MMVRSKDLVPAKERPVYLVTKKFTSGLLKGMTIKERTEIPFIVGRKYTGVCGSSNYTVTALVPWSEAVEREWTEENTKINREIAAKEGRSGK